MLAETVVKMARDLLEGYLKVEDEHDSEEFLLAVRRSQRGVAKASTWLTGMCRAVKDVIDVVQLAELIRADEAAAARWAEREEEEDRAEMEEEEEEEERRAEMEEADVIRVVRRQSTPEDPDFVPNLRVEPPTPPRRGVFAPKGGLPGRKSTRGSFEVSRRGAKVGPVPRVSRTATRRSPRVSRPLTVSSGLESI